jgi:hypothetical protein
MSLALTILALLAGVGGVGWITHNTNKMNEDREDAGLDPLTTWENLFGSGSDSGPLGSLMTPMMMLLLFSSFRNKTTTNPAPDVNITIVDEDDEEVN